MQFSPKVVAPSKQESLLWCSQRLSAAECRSLHVIFTIIRYRSYFAFHYYLLIFIRALTCRIQFSFGNGALLSLLLQTRSKEIPHGGGRGLRTIPYQL